MYKHMSRSERQNKLIELLSDHSVMSVSDLAKQLNSSMMTIRRDLEMLSLVNRVKKVHGGAVLIRKEVDQLPFHDRVTALQEEKNRIGKAATQFIKEGSIIFFDAGTTPYSVVKNLPDNIEFTAITIGLMTAVALCEKPKVNIICIGGNVHHSSYSMMNYMAIDTIRRFRADVAFIATEAISVTEGAFDAQLPLIEVKRAIVEVSQNVILLADHSKFDERSLCLSVPISDFDIIITDDQTRQDHINKLREKGIEVVIA
jgi:DeoR family transcriptional regulator, fructose operon transcriptional repressor